MKYCISAEMQKELKEAISAERPSFCQIPDENFCQNSSEMPAEIVYFGRKSAFLPKDYISAEGQKGFNKTESLSAKIEDLIFGRHAKIALFRSTTKNHRLV